MNRIILFLGVISLSLSISAQSNLSENKINSEKKVKGIVFEDLNRNGKKDRNEKGIAGVAVSNGVDVVKTNTKGEYQLPVDEDNIIFVIKPAGFMTLVNDKNLPLFYYIHKPAGSPVDLRFKGIAPTGPLPESVDFALVKNEESDNFRFFVFGDPQTRGLQEVDYFKRWFVDEAKTVKGMLFGISLGDLASDELDILAPYRDAVAEIGIPWYNVKGNHDRNVDVTDIKYGAATFESYFGPATYVFQYGKTHFFIIDNIIAPIPNGEYAGGFRDDQFKFIENYLKFVDKNDLLIFSMHIPISRGVNDAYRRQFFSLLKGYENVLALSAHTHTQQQVFSDTTYGWDGIKPFHEFIVGTSSGSWYFGEKNDAGIPVATMRDGTPQGYVILNIEGNKYTFDYKVIGKPMGYSMNIYSPKVVPQIPVGWGNDFSFYVNFFLGSPQDKVEYRVGSGDWQEMRRVEEYDPHYIYMMQRWDYSETLLPGQRPMNPSTCYHLWKGSINTELEIGRHKIEVRATDTFGRQHLGEVTYRIEQKK